MKRNLILFIVLIATISCKINDDCGQCFTPPRQFNFKFVDKDTEENLYSNETFDPDYLVVTDEMDDEVEFQLVNYNDSYILWLADIGWELDPKVYTVKLSEEISVIFELDMDHVSENCCSYFIVKDFNLQTFEYTESSVDGIITVKI